MATPTSYDGLRTVVVVGAQWGDEGKGKLVELLTEKSKACVRFNGGANAGHTLVVDGKKLACHVLPCGVVQPNCKNVLGHGMVVNLQALASELKEAEQVLGRNDLASSLILSSRAHLAFGVHLLADAAQEKRQNENFIGTTLRGIGPSYATKALRIGLRASDLLLPDELFAQKFNNLHQFLIQSFDLQGVNIEEELKNYLPLKHRFASCVKDLPEFWSELAAVRSATKETPVIAATTPVTDVQTDVVAEGANATFLDLDLGTYPYCTSSSCTVGGIGGGASLNVRKLWRVVGVSKAYLTRVGQGPMPTELFDAVGEAMCVRGQEFGVSTGRRRRCGWLDVPMLRFSNAVNGYDEIMMTKLDILSDLCGEGLKVCVGYRIEGRVINYYPGSIEELEKVEPVYETIPGWTENIAGITSFDALPQAARDYVDRVEQLIEVPITMIGTGPDRSNIVRRRSPLLR